MSYADVVMADNPIRYYRLEETSGFTASDSMSLQDATYSGSPTLATPAVIGNGCIVGINSSHLAVPFAGLTTGLTIEMWWQGAGGDQLFRDSTNAGGTGWFLTTASGSVSIVIQGSAHVTTVPWTSLNNGLWHHVVLTVSPSEVHLYLDGVSAYSYARTTNVSNIASPLRLGRNGNNASQYRPGMYDEFAIYDYVLPAPRVLAHYQAAFTPNAPTGLTKTGSTMHSVSVEWAAPTSGSAPTGYEYQVDSGTPVSVGLNLQAAIGGLNPGSPYVISVRAVNAGGGSPWTSLLVFTDSAPPEPVGPYTLRWDRTGEKIYEIGVDRGVLYPNNSNGIAWNGLVSAKVSSESGDVDPSYQDGIKRYNRVTNEDIVATLDAFTYPDEFMECDGTKRTQSGIGVGQQGRMPFSLCWRTKIGNDLDGMDHGYKIHILYNVVASPTERPYGSVSNEPGAMSMSWEMNSLPSKIQGYKPTSYFVVDSTKTSPYALAAFENIIYGTEGVLPQLPTLQQVVSFFTDFIVLEVTDLGDGVWMASGPDEVVALLPNEMFIISYYTVIDNEDDTFTMSSG